MDKTSSGNIPHHGQDRHATRSSYNIPFHPYDHPSNLSDFRDAEGGEHRKKRLRELWRQLHTVINVDERRSAHVFNKAVHEEMAPELATSPEETLLSLCGVGTNRAPRSLSWEELKIDPQRKEVEQWHASRGPDLDGCGSSDVHELSLAFDGAGIARSPTRISIHSDASLSSNSVRSLTTSSKKTAKSEIYQCFNVKYMPNGDSCAPRINFESAINGNAKSTLLNPAFAALNLPPRLQPDCNQEDEDLEPDEELLEEDDHHGILEGHTALKFLLAGGVAGAVSRTCTAPFDRLKVFLITRLPSGETPMPRKPSVSNIGIIRDSVARIYAEGGVLAFWTGNGLSVVKIFPESAIKFFTYESAKVAFARYWDCVDDPKKISGTSRFFAGGIGGISSQLSIYPIETAKTQMMCVGQKGNLAGAVRNIYSMGGIRAFYRGLPVGLIGVFPYAAIDMSTFEALKLAYIKSSGKEEPGVLALLAFGSLSGSVGATSVYPLNLMRTRLQASGSPGHPQRYNGVLDVAIKTWERDGWRGFYRGLLPTLAKVIPSVSISYVVYEYSKRMLGV